MWECKAVNKYKESYDVYIGRGSKWGNPFTFKSGTQAKWVVGSREECIQAFEDWITKGDGQHLLKDLPELKGKVLGCFCKPQACHGDVLAKLVNSLPE